MSGASDVGRPAGTTSPADQAHSNFKRFNIRPRTWVI
jgi:hypothetical protein